MVAKMVHYLPFYLAEWEHGTRVFYPTREIHPYLPSRLSPQMADVFAEELAAAADVLREWIREDELRQNKIKIRGIHVPPLLNKGVEDA